MSLSSKRTSPFGPGALSLLLVILLMVQGFLLHNRRGSGVVSVPFEVGEPLPFDAMPVEGDSWQVRLGEAPCVTAFLCSVDCGYCRGLARTIADSLRSAPPSRRPVWLMSGSKEELAQWASHHAVPAEDVFLVSARPRPWPLPPVVASVWVTPTRVIVDQNGILRDARPSPRMLPPEREAMVCSQGGIAVNNVEEYRAMKIQEVSHVYGEPSGDRRR